MVSFGYDTPVITLDGTALEAVLHLPGLFHCQRLYCIWMKWNAESARDLVSLLSSECVWK